MTQLTVAYMLPDSQRLNWQNAVPLFPQWYRATSWLVPGLTTLPSVLPAEKSYGSHEAANSNMHLQSLHAVCLIAITSSRWYIRYKLPKKWNPLSSWSTSYYYLCVLMSRRMISHAYHVKLCGVIHLQSCIIVLLRAFLCHYLSWNIEHKTRIIYMSL